VTVVHVSGIHWDSYANPQQLFPSIPDAYFNLGGEVNAHKFDSGPGLLWTKHADEFGVYAIFVDDVPHDQAEAILLHLSSREF
jgi:hypothetical protein